MVTKITKYQVEDGKVFDTYKEAKDYENITLFLKRPCPYCIGKGIINNTTECYRCHGEGYIKL